jgi:DNA topoisomerase-1
MYKLFIVESPAKCNKIEQYLGPGNKCIASYGHFRELNGLQSININNNFEPTFVISESKKTQVNKISKCIKGASEVFLATDDDREGEAIAWHLCDYFGLSLKTTKRIVFHEVTETALKKAVAEYRYVNMNILYAQLARQVLDVLVGYKVSPILWKNVKDGTSAGRCQTPALRLIYDNYKDIKASPGSKEYNIVGYFTTKNIPFVLHHNNLNNNNNNEVIAFLEASKEFQHTFACGELRDSIKAPPTPFTTSKIQQAASTNLHTSPKDTMKICQRLYEEGFITYMRTDSDIYAEEFVDKAAAYIEKEYGQEYKKESGRESDKKDKKESDKKDKKESDKKDKKTPLLTQDAHEAIRPTDINIKTLAPDIFSSKECKMYQLIWSNTVESCMAPAIYKGLTATITSPQDHIYKVSTEQVIFPGWKIVNGCEEVNKDFVFLQTLKQGSIMKYKKITAKVSMKDMKSHYTEAKLVHLLEHQGIGRPSTFSSLIDKIQERGYVKKENVNGISVKCVDYELSGNKIDTITSEREFGNEKNKLVIKPLGIMVLDYLVAHINDVFEYDYTKHMEDQLDLIAQGAKVWHELCRECLTDLDASIKDISDKNKGKETIRIDNEHMYMMGKYGPVIKCTSAAGTSAAGASTSAAGTSTSAAGTSASAAGASAAGAGTSAGTESTTKTRKKENNDNITFKSVKPDIDLEKLRSGEYTLQDILAEPSLTGGGRPLGLYKTKEVVLKSGKFGWYVEWSGERKGLKLTLDEASALNLDDILDTLFDMENGDSAMIRVISKETSIRKGKFGDYIFHKNHKMKKPKFLKLTEFKEDYKTCDIELILAWLKKTYKSDHF